jgi:V-type H+-transporting ATPase proteolipid subunit
MILSSWGAAWGTWKAGLGLCEGGVDHVKGVIKNIVPIVMAGVLGIYGLIVSVIITQAISPPGGEGYNTYSVYNGFTHVSTHVPFVFQHKVCCLTILGGLSTQLAAGLCCGLSCLAAGGTIGVIGDAGVRGFGLKASRGRKWYWDQMEGSDDKNIVGDDGEMGAANAIEGANKLYVGTLIMLIFSEALAL